VWVSVMLLFVGAAMLAGAWRETLMQSRLRREGVRAEGTVMRNERDPDLEGIRRTFPIVAYTDTAGDRRECRGAMGSRYGWPVDKQVEVLYLPGRPRTARIDTTSQRVAAISVLVLGGLALMAVGVLINVMK
jgi:Protein of unknown function (DUF3592)